MQASGDSPAVGLSFVKFSVVVPCFNAQATLGRQLTALAGQTEPPFEVIVADNGSTDGTVEVARQFGSAFQRFRLVDAGQRRGVSHARNSGARVATGDVLAFCDADDEVADGWLAGLHRALLAHDFVASRFDLLKLNESTQLSHPQQRGLICDADFDFLPRAGGCGLAVRRNVHEKVGGFDEGIRFHEDTDYCWKIQLAGHELAFAPDALVHVQMRRGSKARFRQARLWAAAQVVVYKKYRRLGMAKVSNREALKDWYRLARILLRVALSRQVPESLPWRLGTRLGRLQGSLLCLVLLL